MDFKKLLKNGMPANPIAVRGISLDSLSLALNPPYLIPPSKETGLIGRHYFVPISPNFEASGLSLKEGYTLLNEGEALEEAKKYASYHAKARFLERILGFEKEPEWLKHIDPSSNPEEFAYYLVHDNGLSEEKAMRIAEVIVKREGVLLFPDKSLFDNNMYRPGKKSGYITIISGGGIDIDSISGIVPLGKEEKYILESLKTSGDK